MKKLPSGTRVIMPRREFERNHLRFTITILITKGCRLANKFYLKVADLAAIESEYPKAISHYEKVGNISVNNNLMKWSVKDYFFKAGICHLASGVRIFSGL
jgi:hypothetical protein